jgi:rubrerythrin
MELPQLQEPRAAEESFGGDYVAFWPAGASGKGEFCCVACGYGAVVRSELPSCPMCGERLSERSAWSPFRRASRMI